MSALEDRIKLSRLLYGKDIVDYFKNNSLFLYEKYKESDDDCQSISILNIVSGGFYFLHYKDSSNWMSYSPIFCIDYRVVNTNLTIILGINFNFIPLEIRSYIFDKFISEEQFENNSYLKVDFTGVYKNLIRYGFEYAIVEYNISKILRVHRISLNLLPRFLYSTHPVNKYDPNKLVQIWNSKLKNRDKRHQEVITSLLNEFYDINNDISDKYDQLKGHIKRLQSNLKNL